MSHSNPLIQPDAAPTLLDNLDRRAFVLLGAATLLGGCASASRSSRLPEVPWTARRSAESTPNTATRPAPTAADIRRDSTPGIAGVLPRAAWARGTPNYGNMNRMLPVRYVTLHHDGMRPFYESSESQSAARIELIRQAHRGQGWGDIGYHFVVDRAGRVWEARPLAYQGAHVKDHNEGNIGVLSMGNFDEQVPTEAQIQGVVRHISTLMRAWRLPTNQLRSHQEWAPTACPGRNMQPRFASLRSNGAFG